MTAEPPDRLATDECFVFSAARTTPPNSESGPAPSREGGRNIGVDRDSVELDSDLDLDHCPIAISRDRSRQQLKTSVGQDGKVSVLKCCDPADDLTVSVDNDKRSEPLLAAGGDHRKFHGLPGDAAGVDPDSAGVADE